jgi:hypothetical protein
MICIRQKATKSQGREEEQGITKKYPMENEKVYRDKRE